MIKKKVITRYDSTPYLIRYTLFTCPWFSIKIHKILASDDACLHDHPWAFVSIILKNGYTEVVDREPKGIEAMTLPLGSLVRTKKYYGAGSVLFRKATHLHRLIVTKPVTTLVITFKKTRSWGFLTPKGWVFWERYRQGENTCE